MDNATKRAMMTTRLAEAQQAHTRTLRLIEVAQSAQLGAPEASERLDRRIAAARRAGCSDTDIDYYSGRLL